MTTATVDGPGMSVRHGMNDAGLAMSLTFGGRFVHGRGFAVPLVLRHLLETCRTADEAVDGLHTMPVAIPQNVTLADAHQSVTVHMGPGIPMTEAQASCAAHPITSICPCRTSRNAPPDTGAVVRR
ncbi:carcinine hydrolase/isopenicillin-N N-acyltransferase family protein [Streptomyces viridosporus]|uniref:carcinine hydrolase/isopenicillin-N N-acyltransferase family protein n=1 Tax=Streptomyces viridosporus TaxID=67581 RepID=UPI0036FC209C